MFRCKYFDLYINVRVYKLACLDDMPQWRFWLLGTSDSKRTSVEGQIGYHFPCENLIKAVPFSLSFS